MIRARIMELPDEARNTLREEWNDLRLQKQLHGINQLRESDRAAVGRLLDIAEAAVDVQATACEEDESGGDKMIAFQDRTTDTDSTPDIATLQAAMDAVVVCPACGEPTAQDNPRCKQHPF